MISDRIKAARKKKGWSQKVLAEKVQMDQGNIAKIENGKSITGATLKRIADQLEMPVEYFTTDDQSGAFDEARFNNKVKQIPKLSLNGKKALDVILDALLDLGSIQNIMEKHSSGRK